MNLRVKVDPSHWNDWRWQLGHRLTCLGDLEACVRLTDAERAGVEATPFRLGITPYYASLMDPDHPSCPVRMQAIPVAAEARRAARELEDPLGEESLSPVPAIVHRYPDRVLLLALDRCAVYCRHCNRRRRVGIDESAVDRGAIEGAIDYIRATPAIKDVLISGGDPLTLATEKLEWILGAVRAVPHVEIIRIGTRVPVCLPMRVDEALCAMLRRYHPLYVNTHFNHPKEVTAEARAACEKLADSGVPLGNQTVLLRGVNSSARILEELFRALLRMRVRPYYLFQGDPVWGTDHLRTPVAVGVEIVEQLRGRLSGMAIPHLVIDAPSGAGKVPIGASGLVAWAPERVTLRTWQGKIVDYPEPAERDSACPYDEIYLRSGASGA